MSIYIFFSVYAYLHYVYPYFSSPIQDVLNLKNPCVWADDDVYLGIEFQNFSLLFPPYALLSSPPFLLFF